MIKICKTNMLVQVVALLQVWKAISVSVGLPLVLAESWFVVSFWLMVAFMVISLICILPILTMSYSEGKSSVRNFGTEPLSKLLWVYPYIVYAAVFVQYGEFGLAFCSIACWATFAALFATHDKVLKRELEEAAKRGNVRPE